MDKVDITISGNIATWTLPPTPGEVSGTYTGTFQFRCFLSPTQVLECGREYRSLLGSLSDQATEAEGNLAFALGQLKHRVLKSPPFWSSTLQDGPYAGNIPDINIILLVLDAAVLSETIYKEQMSEERDKLVNGSIKIVEDLLKKDKEV